MAMRIYLEPDDQMLAEINQAAKKTGVGKAQFVLEAVDHFLHNGDQGELAQLQRDLDKARDDLNSRWSEITTLRAEITALKAELDKARSAYEKAMIDNQALREAADQARGEAEALRHDQEHYKQTIDLITKQTAFLEGHVSQLTQSISQLSLKPGEEEIKAKHWWQFWKR
jgi:chromosome segregation ATPase